MPVHVVRLGSPREVGEGLRNGTARRPPRGGPGAEVYDVWLPDLAPSEELVKLAQGAGDDGAWRTFERKYRAEMKHPTPSRLLDLLAALSRQTSFAVGCYCADEAHCHRSVLRELLAERGAEIA